MARKSSAKAKVPKADYDGPWKEALEHYLRSVLTRCFPVIAAAVDWAAGFTFLDKELQKVVRQARLGPLRVDKLVSVRLLTGEEQWILLHVEVASQPYVDLARRMYQYHYRLEERFRSPVVSVAILADPEPNWRPDTFHSGLLGCEVQFRFPTCKLLDLVQDRAALEEDADPAAIVILAHVAALQTRGDMNLRLREKIALTRLLYKRGYKREDIEEIYRLIDWLIALPEEYTLQFEDEVAKMEKEKKIMPYITSLERLGLKRGRKLGREEGRKEGRTEGREEGRTEGRKEGHCDAILRQLSKRFGDLPDELTESIQQLSSKRVSQLLLDLLDFRTLDDVRHWLQHGARS